MTEGVDEYLFSIIVSFGVGDIPYDHVLPIDKIINPLDSYSWRYTT
ncbi:MAG: hypothetical protein LBP54_06255 [Campylobacteraceae bacterium]|nr:hypothetical protein [Campylobacteraceae bacterium]